ncbi:MAG: HIT family protein [Desulfuromonas sp.]|nr:HIT family protein [Desulfuromonas sp.]
MTNFNLNQQLDQDCITLGRLGSTHLLLLNNSLVPWFILVPQTDRCEIHDMPRNEQIQLLDDINLLATFIEREFNTDKINTAAIGNIVRQLHIHVIGRYEDDFCWPQVVWGRPEEKSYTNSEVADIRSRLLNGLADHFTAIV